MEALTRRELEVLRLIADGRTTKQLAAQLGMAFKTASCHRYRLMNKIGAANAVELVSMATRAGMLSLPVPDTGANGHVELEMTRLSLALEESRKHRQRLNQVLAEFRTHMEELKAAREEFEALRHQVFKMSEALVETARKGIITECC